MCDLVTSRGRKIQHDHVSGEGHVTGSSEPEKVCYTLPLYEHDPDTARSRVEGESYQFLMKWQQADSRFQMVENATPCYNCIGKVFGGKRMQICDIASVESILEDDRYYSVGGPAQIRDIVVYRLEGAITHVGFVHEVDETGTVAVVQSKWGILADYLHGLYSVPSTYGQPEIMRTDLPTEQRTRSPEST